MENKKSSSVFAGKQFCFSCSFPADHVDFHGPPNLLMSEYYYYSISPIALKEYVNQVGGEVVDNQVEANVHFIVECHGVLPSETVKPYLLLNVHHHLKESHRTLAEICLADFSFWLINADLALRADLVPQVQSDLLWTIGAAPQAVDLRMANSKGRCSLDKEQSEVQATE
ncbi:hypothetical protein ACH5RR_000993 [Cinchona calisaya]|uniref:BRCT domain-containing protein n=1 Tax=Cinchona calisaya TaxID=153742 RepID=A0ABD3B3B5_9GENT